MSQYLPLSTLTNRLDWLVLILALMVNESHRLGEDYKSKD